MKKILMLLILAISFQLSAQNKPIEKYKPFPFGTVKPTGWIHCIRKLMTKNIISNAAIKRAVLPDYSVFNNSSAENQSLFSGKACTVCHQNNRV